MKDRAGMIIVCARIISILGAKSLAKYGYCHPSPIKVRGDASVRWGHCPTMCGMGGVMECYNLKPLDVLCSWQKKAQLTSQLVKLSLRNICFVNILNHDHFSHITRKPISQPLYFSIFLKIKQVTNKSLDIKIMDDKIQFITIITTEFTTWPLVISHTKKTTQVSSASGFLCVFAIWPGEVEKCHHVRPKGK